VIADRDVTGICVCYNTKELMERAFTSIRKFHPRMKIIVIDNSDRRNDCYAYVNRIVSPITFAVHTNANIGHGKGLVLALEKVKTPFVLAFDSDIEMLKSPVQAMLNMMEDDTWGVGYIEKTDLGGFDFGARPDQMKHGSMKYMHPYFQLVQMKEYKKYDPYIHHGAPCVATMLEIHKKGLSDKVLKEFEGLGHSSGTGFAWVSAPREFIRHDIAGTRNSNKKVGKPEIEGAWEYPNPRKKYTDIILKDKEELIAPEEGKITAVTLTGDRPVCLSLLQKWVNNQTVKPDQWIVVDDGVTPYRPSINCDYIRRTPLKTDPKFTLVPNMRVALEHIENERIVFLEDDEYYAPKYIETMMQKLANHHIVGIGKSKYYHLPTFTYYQHRNCDHASLAQTAMKYLYMNNLAAVLDGDSFLDIRLWAHLLNATTVRCMDSNEIIKDGKVIGKKGMVFEETENESLYCGMKGMMGRGGIGSGHKGIGTKDTVEYDILKKWIPNDYQDYLSLMNWWK